MRVFSTPDFPANEMVTQTNFTLSVTLPSKGCDHCIMRFRYISNNPDEIDPSNNTQAIFYNCADIRILSSSASSPPRLSKPFAKRETPSAAQVSESGKAAGNAFSCCTAPQWEGWAFGYSPLGLVQHHIYYDAVNKLVRWEQFGALESPALLQRITIANYTLSKAGYYAEYVVYPQELKCELYGADTFYPWCYGEGYGRPLVQQNLTLGNTTLNVWGNADVGFMWTSTVHECLPFSALHQGTSLQFTDVRVGSISPQVFGPPTYCNAAPLMLG